MRKPTQTIRRWFLLLGTVLLLAGSASAQAAAPKRVLFVGNSFTYFYNLPQVVSAMAADQGVAIETRQSTVGGSNLEQHWKEERNTKTRELIAQGGWDYVVFNNHSLSSIETPESFLEYGKKFAELVRAQGGEPVFMLTWAYDSNPLLQPQITAMHQRLATETGADYVPGGPLFAAARAWRPDLELFFDDKHPSPNGTYLLGLAFFHYFTGQSVAGIPDRITTPDRNGEKLYLLFILPEDAAFLRQLVAEFEFPALATD